VRTRGLVVLARSDPQFRRKLCVAAFALSDASARTNRDVNLSFRLTRIIVASETRVGCSGREVRNLNGGVSDNPAKPIRSPDLRLD
jgi:hypothetical protein